MGITYDWLFKYLENKKAEKQLEKKVELLEAKVMLLQSTCIAAAEEIKGHWNAHCDKDGYGPNNLLFRLENGVGGFYPGYMPGQFTQLENRIEELKESIVQHVSDAYTAGYDEALNSNKDATLAKLEYIQKVKRDL